MPRVGFYVPGHSSTKPHRHHKAINGPSVVACEAEEKKRVKYASLAQSFWFVPVGVETTGALGDGADDLFHELGRRIAACCKD